MYTVLGAEPESAAAGRPAGRLTRAVCQAHQPFTYFIISRIYRLRSNFHGRNWSTNVGLTSPMVIHILRG